MTMTTEYLEKILQKDLNSAAFNHCIDVAGIACELACIHNCDSRKAYIAGLLHDCAFKYSNSEIIRLAKRFEICKQDNVSINPAADYHARLGVYVARADYGIDDPEILQAIARHEIGQIPMTKLDIIVSLAECIETSKNGITIDKIRALSKVNLVEAYIEKCGLNILYLIDERKQIPTELINVYNYIQGLTDADI